MDSTEESYAKLDNYHHNMRTIDTGSTFLLIRRARIVSSFSSWILDNALEDSEIQCDP